MDTGALTIGYVMFDCHDPDCVATFWQALLGLEFEARRGPYVFLRGTGDLAIGFQRVETSKTAKNRVHLDLIAGDIASASDQVCALGGSKVEGYADGGFVVMADPEGNEFCLIPRAGANVDADGRAHYEV